MASNSSSGNSSGLQNSGSEDGLTDQRKRKRMESNRESARRSRMKKQQQLNDLLAQADKLKTDNSQISSTIGVTTQRFVQIEADNSVLRAQVSELSQRLDSLNEIINYINVNTNSATAQCMNEFDFVENPWNMMDFNHNQQPIMASAADMFGY